MRRVNKGFITVEASLVVPLFLFFMLGMSGIYMVLMAEAHVHQALACAVDYVAQYSYLEKRLLTEKLSDNKQTGDVISIDRLVDTVVISQKLSSYLGDDFYIDKIITGGKNGILIRVEADPLNEKIMIVTASYSAKMSLPLLGTYSIPLSNQIKQKAFVGFSKEEGINDDYYVYVTPNKEVYHLRRNCTYLVLDIKAVSASNKNAYEPCYYCGLGQSGKNIYITKEKQIYHNTRDCVGLKRTVNRVKLSTVKGIGVCSRCGG